ncbi:hypothetical protein MKX03_024360 [Papaver bracteatum]|nr:hypothetical protein MKX03_024360 [Papaver bracteatum]
MKKNPTPSGVEVSALEVKKQGSVAQIIMPNIYTTLVVKGKNVDGELINVTFVAMSVTYGMKRGMEVIDTRAALSIPVGGTTLERVFNILGEPVDNLDHVDTRITSPIYRSAPAFI